MKLKSRVAGAAVAGGLALGGLGGLAPGADARPLIAGGLVNVQVSEVQIIDDVEVDVVVQDVNLAVNAALALAANVCDTTIAVIAQDLRDGRATCENEDTGDSVVLRQR
jgi:hypothetical protein